MYALLIVPKLHLKSGIPVRGWKSRRMNTEPLGSATGVRDPRKALNMLNSIKLNQNISEI